MQRLLQAVRPVMPTGLSEEMGYGMITWVVPFSVLPTTYNGQPLGYAALANQKNYLSFYLPLISGVTMSDEEFRHRWQAPKSPNLGKSCLRFTQVDNIDLPLVLEVIASATMAGFVEHYLSIKGAL